MQPLCSAERSHCIRFFVLTTIYGTGAGSGNTLCLETLASISRLYFYPFLLYFWFYAIANAFRVFVECLVIEWGPSPEVFCVGNCRTTLSIGHCLWNVSTWNHEEFVHRPLRGRISNRIRGGRPSWCWVFCSSASWVLIYGGSAGLLDGLLNYVLSQSGIKYTSWGPSQGIVNSVQWWEGFS